MATFIDEGYRTFTTGEALSPHRRVKLSSGSVVYADAGQEAIGATTRLAASGDVTAIALTSKQGTFKLEMASSCSVGDTIYGAADGKGSTTQAGKPVGVALAAASGSGSIIEILPRQRFDLGASVDVIRLFDDFLHYVSGDNFTTTATDSGTAADGDAVGGAVTLQPSDGTVADNDEIYLATTQECFKFATGKALTFEARVACTEANTDDMNVMVGLMDAVAANSLLDDAGGPKASYSGAVFYKVDGGTEWQAEVSIGATQTAVTLSTATFPGDGTYQKLRIEFLPGSGATDGTVNFYIDGALVGQATSFSYGSATEMDCVVGVKNGDTNNEQVDVDYVLCEQER